MPDTPDQDNGFFEVEPIEQLDGSPVPQKQQRWATLQPWKLGLSGFVALIEGLGLLGFFYLSPWFSWMMLASPGLHQTIRSLHYPWPTFAFSGWAVAQGVPVAGPSFGFAPLQFIPLVALGLLILAALQWRLSPSQRLLSTALFVLSALGLLIERGFYLQVHALPGLYGGWVGADVSWGFWGALAVTVAGIVVGIHRLWPAHMQFPAFLPAARGAAARQQ